jgi:FkbM family methyltransferase
LKVLGQLRIGVRSIGYGDRLRDKAAIGLLLFIYLLFPLGSLARKLGRPLPDPARLIKSYRCRSADGIFICPGPGGPSFLACDPTYDPGVAGVIESLTSGTFLDIGANVGFFTVKAAKRLEKRGSVIAIEPHPVRFGLLRQNVALNGLDNVTCLPFAVGSENGRAAIYEPDPSFGPHRLDISCAPIGSAAIDVEMRTVDSLLQALRISELALVKIDVEGFEPEVIGGMLQLLGDQPVPVIFEALDGHALENSVARLRPLGYVVEQIDQQNFLARRAAC